MIALKRSLVCLGFLLCVGCTEQGSGVPAKQAIARAELRRPISGIFDARVRLNSGMFRVPVLIDADQVKCIKWSKDPCVNVFDAKIEDGRALGMAANGELVQIELIE